MIKNILSVLIFLFTISFLFLVTNTYFSNNQQIMIKKNREKILQTIQNKINGLPILVNDTENVIEYNSGFEEDKNNIKRNFWKLFKKND
jgi:hypothetical protein|tara:strand:- start:550 stop:816 length:267 start_codon:yes stop_codon:yes gene_type:complete